MNVILVLGLLSDPELPAASCKRTGGYNRCLNETLEIARKSEIPTVMVCTAAEKDLPLKKAVGADLWLYRIPYWHVDRGDPAEIARSAQWVLTEILQLMDRENFQPVLIHSFYWLSGHIANLLRLQHKIPYVHTVIDLAVSKRLTGSNLYYPQQEAWEREFLKNADFIFAITNSEKETLTQYYDLPEKTIICQGRDVPEELLCPDHDDYGGAGLYSVPEGEPALPAGGAVSWWANGAYTFIGRLYEVKGLQQIFQAWALLWQEYKGSTPPLWIVGGSPDQIAAMRETLAQSLPQLTSWEQSGKIIWWGYLSARGIGTILMHTRALVMHSRYEGGGRVVIEAMSAARPVLATPNGFARDMVRNWYNGFLIPFGDVRQLAGRMELMLLQPYLATSLGHTAHTTYLQYKNSWKYQQCQLAMYQAYWLHTAPVLQPAAVPELPPGDAAQRRLCCYPFEKAGSEQLGALLADCNLPAATLSWKEVFLAGEPHEVWKTDGQEYLSWGVLLHSRLEETCLWHQGVSAATHWRQQWSILQAGCKNPRVICPAVQHSRRPFFVLAQEAGTAVLPQQEPQAALACLFQFECAPLPAPGILPFLPCIPCAPACQLLPLKAKESLEGIKKDLEASPFKKFALEEPRAWYYGKSIAGAFRKVQTGEIRLLPCADMKQARRGQAAASLILAFWKSEPEQTLLKEWAQRAQDAGYRLEALNYWLLLAQWERVSWAAVQGDQAKFEKAVSEWYLLFEQISSQ